MDYLSIILEKKHKFLGKECFVYEKTWRFESQKGF